MLETGVEISLDAARTSAYATLRHGLIFLQVLLRLWSANLNRRRAVFLKNAFSSARSASSCFLWRGSLMAFRVFAGIGFQVEQFAGPLPGPLDVLQIFRANAPHVFILEIEAIPPLRPARRAGPRIASAWTFCRRARGCEVIEIVGSNRRRRSSG